MSIIVEALEHTYMPGTPYEYTALKGISTEIKEGEFLGIIGRTGSGKSTFVQHLNGLLKPTGGRVIVDEIDLTDKKADKRAVRQKVGLVFQYPEHQLFEEKVFDDIAYGPRNMGLVPDKVTSLVKQAMEMVGLDFDSFQQRSPFTLSGGEKRKVAIAGVLAMSPKYLILDEPTAGLDPRGRDDILSLVQRLREKHGMTIIFVSHSMEDIARLVDRILVIHQGEIILTGSPREIFTNYRRLKDIGLGVPLVTELMYQLKQRGYPVNANQITVDEARDEIIRWLRGRVYA